MFKCLQNKVPEFWFCNSIWYTCSSVFARRLRVGINLLHKLGIFSRRPYLYRNGALRISDAVLYSVLEREWEIHCQIEVHEGQSCKICICNTWRHNNGKNQISIKYVLNFGGHLSHSTIALFYLEHRREPYWMLVRCFPDISWRDLKARFEIIAENVLGTIGSIFRIERNVLIYGRVFRRTRVFSELPTTIRSHALSLP